LAGDAKLTSVTRFTAPFSRVGYKFPLSGKTQACARSILRYAILPRCSTGVYY
jgi:hypothetical protein